ncbi:Oxysterol-binding protein [Panus rudis PR-1116 ss-1]|nr:Oxysterol-binding protein [Panus rudis PR-1116 ss-1]
MSGTQTPTENPGEVVPQSQKGSWTSFIKSIASFSGDLYSLTAPPFILSPISLTEFPAYWCERPELFAAIADARNDEARNIRVLRWFISTLKGQYTSRNEKLGSEKKPLNPVLGELFYGYWPSGPSNRGQTNLVVEQVSHHPPITAYNISNPSKGLELTGHSAQKTSFSAGSIIVKQIGHAVLTVSDPVTKEVKEQFVITLPRLRIDGLWYGSPYIELAETSYIVGSSGWMSVIEYKGKGYFGGKSHQFKASLYPPPLPTPSLRTLLTSPTFSAPPLSTLTPKHTYEGLWHQTSKNVKTGEVFTDVTMEKEEVSVKSVEEMGEWESRRLWRNVARGIREGDFESASREKSKIENEQRQRRKDEQAAGTKWELRHFEHVDNDPLYEQLGKLYKANPPTEDFYVFRHNGPWDGGEEAERDGSAGV